MEDIWGEILQGILRPNLLKISDFVVASRLGHPLNALSRMLVTLEGISMDVKR